jgi:hypothetical protein
MPFQNNGGNKEVNNGTSKKIESQKIEIHGQTEAPQQQKA